MFKAVEERVEKIALDEAMLTELKLVHLIYQISRRRTYNGLHPKD